MFLKKITSLLSLIVFTFWTFFMAGVGVLQNLIFNRRKFDNWIITTWGRVACGLFNVDVQVVGLEKLVPKQGAILLFNHSSFIDILAMHGFINNIRFGAKIELFKIPIFAQAMKRFGTLPIARNNREEVFKVYEEARIRFARGEKFALSPEGGRFHGEQLSRFKSGPFVFAINAQVPLIPVVIKGAYACWPKESILPNADRVRRTIRIEILDPVMTAGIDVKNRSQLQDLCYDKMNSVYVR